MPGPDRRIDLNADLGEGFGVWHLGDDDALLDLVTSANVACGFHAGDPVIMRGVCAAASDRGVTIGAQVSYRDLAGFGRRRMDVAPDELAADVLYQLGALDGFARVAGSRVAYVKPHGALYNTASDDITQARAISAAVAAYDASLPLLGLPGSALAEAAAETGLGFVTEAFADRAYTPAGRLVSRREPDAVLHDPDAVVERAVRFATSGEVTATDGSTVAVAPGGVGSICLHGDTPGAASLARAVRDGLLAAGITLGAFA